MRAGTIVTISIALERRRSANVATLVETIQTRMNDSFVRVTADGRDLILSLAASADQLGQLVEKDSGDSPVAITVN